MSVEYLELADYLAIAAEVTGLSVETLTRVAKLDLADSALHAPAAGFGDTEFYPDFIDKAAVLIVRLAKNHPLPDGNKRAAWVALRLFVEINDWQWATTPTIDESERAVIAIAPATGTSAEPRNGCGATWRDVRVNPPERPVRSQPARSPGSLLRLVEAVGQRCDGDAAVGNRQCP